MHESTGARGAASLFLALSCVGFISSPAYADDAGQSDVRSSDTDEIIVTGEQMRELESPKATAPLLDTPQTVTVISDQTLRRQNLLSLRDALSTVPGITFGAGEGGGGYGDSINLRGYSANNDITVDGVRDSAQYSRTDPFNLQQIEVYNGANSVFNGSGSVGGTINLVSKVPQAEDLTILQAAIGTDNYYRATIDTNQRVTDLIAVRLNAMYHRNDIPGRDVEENERWGVAPSITFGIGSPTSLTLAYVHQRDDNVPVFGVPYYAAFGGPLDPYVDDSDYFGIVNLDEQEITVDRLTATFNHEFSDALSIRNLTRWQRVAQYSQTSAPQGTWCLPTGLTPLGVACPAGQNAPGFYYPSGPRGLVRDQENQLLYNQTDLRWASGEAGRLRNTLVVGASFAREDYQLTNAQLLRNPGGATPNPVLPPIPLSNPDTTWTGPVNFVLTGISYGESRNAAVYAFDTLEIGPLFEINGGVRWENVRNIFRADTYATPASGGAYTRGTDQVSDESLFSYRAGLVFHPIPTASLYVAYANSKTPSSNTVRAGCTSGSGATLVDFCGVAPETARNIEIGGKIDLFDRRLQLTAALFRNERTNFRVASNEPGVPDPQVLDGRSRVDGIALGATGNITENWSIFANYTYLDGDVLQAISDFCLANPGAAGCGNSVANPDPQRGNILQQTPKHSGSLFTTYSFPFGLQVGYGLTYQGSIALNQSTLAAPQQFRADSYMTHRFYAAYAFANGLTAQVNVQNAFNERYFTGIRNNGWAVPGEDRSAVFSLFYSF
ncbi:TonB-dependent receptor [Sphingosinicella sp. LHD-64]|uniref:TonB-dependent receptor n=1 Tax=Sphingosinicella sp. LHD-64 TaxID=3072139 RepID=UPI00280E6D05|nr:TonB-dependent receptor [Sphingosinicella sp. LHD-64]MDQ8756581.1 TonB-dependent receptor [Sphingosinicella sp. LHD-64]